MVLVLGTSTSCNPAAFDVKSLHHNGSTPSPRVSFSLLETRRSMDQVFMLIPDGIVPPVVLHSHLNLSASSARLQELVRATGGSYQIG